MRTRRVRPDGWGQTAGMEQEPEREPERRSERRRLRDGLVGAGVAVLIMVLAVVVLLLAITRSASSGAVPTGPAEPTTPPAPGASAGRPPGDLAPGDLWLTGLTLDAQQLASPDGVLHDVVVSGQDVRTGASGLVAGALTVDATVPFELVAGQIGPDVAVGPVRDRPEEAAVSRSFEALGRVLDVEATGTVRVRDGLLVIEPRTIDLGGPPLLADLLGALARELVTIEHQIEGLPDGLVLLDVAVQDDGFRARLGGTDVRIEP